MGPRHAVRPAVERPHRGDPDVAAADREVALRLEARAGLGRGAPVQRLPAPARLAEVNHPLRAARAPSRGHRWRTGEAGSAAVAGCAVVRHPRQFFYRVYRCGDYCCPDERSEYNRYDSWRGGR